MLTKPKHKTFRRLFKQQSVSKLLRIVLFLSDPVKNNDVIYNWTKLKSKFRSIVISGIFAACGVYSLRLERKSFAGFLHSYNVLKVLIKISVGISN